MKALTLSFLLFISLAASAQRATPVTDEEFVLAGELLEKSAQKRGEAMIIVLGCAGASAIGFALGGETGQVTGPILGAAALGFSIGFNIAAINKQARAGRILQGKPK